MRIFGRWRELIDIIFRTSGDNKEVTVQPPSTLTGASNTFTTPNISGTTDTIVSRVSDDSGANRLQNKELSDDNVRIVDAADTSKKIEFDASGITTSNTRVFGVPDANDTLVGEAASQTLTNKSIDADNNTITNIDNDEIKAAAGIDATKLADGSVDNSEFQLLGTVGTDASGELVSTDGTQTLSNKSIDADANTITNIEDADIKAGAAINATKIADGSVDNTEFQLLGTAGTDAAGELVLTDSAQDLSQKTFSDTPVFEAGALLNEETAPSTPSAGTGRLFLDSSDDKLKFINEAGVTTEMGGGGSGSGEINYIENPDAEDNNTTGWATYADAAGAEPVDGTGGTANITFTAQSTTVLRGVNSFELGKDAADRQGEGASYDFTIDPADENKELKISFDFKTTSAYAANDIRVYVYDVTNSQLITPSSFELPKFDGDGGTFLSSFSSTDSNSYRLIFHIASTNASAYDLFLDNIIVGPGSVAKGAVISGWKEYTPTIQGFGTPTNVNFFYRRIGDGIEIRGEFTSGTPTADEAQLGLPSGLTIGGSSINPLLTGSFARNVASSSTDSQTNILTTAGDAFLNVGGYPNDLRIEPQNGDDLASSGEAISFTTDIIPVQEWTGSGLANLLSDDVVFANARARIFLNSNQNVGNTATDKLNLGGTSFDNSGMVGTNLIRIPVTGTYRVGFGMGTTASAGLSSDEFSVSLRINNVSQSTVRITPNVSFRKEFQTITLELDEGDEVELFATNNTGGVVAANAGENNTYLEVIRMPEFSAGQAVGFGEATSNNFGLVKLNRWQRKILTSDQSTSASTFVPGLEFQNLVIGKIYKFTASLQYVRGADTFSSVEIRSSSGGALTSSSNFVKNIEFSNSTSGQNIRQLVEATVIFECGTDTQRIGIVTGSSFIGTLQGDPSGTESVIYLEELNNYAPETSDFT